jgi:hypothetical protein
VRCLDIKGVRVVVVHLDPMTFSGQTDGQEVGHASEVVRALRAAGVTVYPVRQGDDLSVALSGSPKMGR